MLRALLTLAIGDELIKVQDIEVPSADASLLKPYMP